ncbi:MAG: 50S ribosomal protein L32e [Candidatus Aenigmarchaeota archaeon]|nr:50S ribosomal protein L32e [Candidatus Aenigmarchaeota archaeon]
MNPRKKPKFLRVSAKAYKRLGKKWRKPRGYHAKLRRREKSKGKMPSPGYGAPKALRCLHPSGFKEVLINSIKDLEKVDPKNEAIKIAHTVGKKKRQEIIKKAEELKIKVLNP